MRNTKACLPIDDSDMDAVVRREKCENSRGLGSRSEPLTRSPSGDALTDDGQEVFNSPDATKKFENVSLRWRHLNMCVLGRPSLSGRWSNSGKKSSRDALTMTDTCTNPSGPPGSNHFTGHRSGRGTCRTNLTCCPLHQLTDISGEPRIHLRRERSKRLACEQRR